MKRLNWNRNGLRAAHSGRQKMVQLDIADILLEHRTILLWDGVDDDSSRSVVTRILALVADDPHSPIQLIINSYGGSVTDCLAIYDAMQTVPAGVQTICFGAAYSAGAFLLAAGSKGNRLVLPNAEVMIHELSSWLHGSYQDLKIGMAQLNRMQTRLTGLLAKHTGKSVKAISEDTARDLYLYAEDAVKYGLADRIVDGKAIFCNPPSPRRRGKHAKKSGMPAVGSLRKRLKKARRGKR